MKAASTSAAKMNMLHGVKQHGEKFLVENGKWISAEELMRSADEGFKYFQAHHRPRNSRAHLSQAGSVESTQPTNVQTTPTEISMPRVL